MTERIITTVEDYLSYEAACRLYRAGVVSIQNGQDQYAYDLDSGQLIPASRGNVVTGYVLAPTIALVVKWLRETYGVYIEYRADSPSAHWCDINARYNSFCFDYLHVTGCYDTPQAAYEAAISHALDHLTDKVILSSPAGHGPA